MEKKINVSKVVAFDLDGTLIDSAPDITEALNYVLKKNGLLEVQVKDVKSIIGTGAKALIKDAFFKQGCDIQDIEELTLSFLKKYKKCFINKTSLFPYTKIILEKLKSKDYKIVLVSNKPEYYSKELLKHFGISKYFSYISGGDTFHFRKPDARHLKQTIENANILNYHCIFVGDSKFDLQCAMNSNIPCILLTHGYSDIDIRKLEAFKIISSLENITEIIDSYFQSIL